MIPDIEYAKASSQLYPALIGYAIVVNPSYQMAQKQPIVPEIGTNTFKGILDKNILKTDPIIPIPAIARI